MHTLMLFAVFLVGCGGRKVVVLGDSNTCRWPHTGCLHEHTFEWPARMTARGDWPRWTVVNRALPSMTAAKYGDGGTFTNGEPGYAAWHLERLLREDLADACTFVRRPKLVLALGTNDVQQLAPIAIAGAIVALVDQAHAAGPCIDVYVATIPPRIGWRKVIAQANMALRMLVPADHVIPFDSQTVTDLRSDGTHMTAEGAQHRADLAFPVLFPAS
jgi:lysophospholipase L1-like esterase